MLNILWKNSYVQKFGKFAVIGGIGTIINYSVFLTLLFFGVNYIISSSTGYITGVIFSFVFNKKITFKSDRKIHKEIFQYFLVYLISLLLGLSLLRFFVEIMNIPVWMSNILIIGFTTITNFLGLDFIVFNKSFGIPKIFKSRLFLFVLSIKIILSFLFASDFLVKGTIPFVNYFVQSGLNNPYEFFFNLGELKVFPYPPFMLYIFAVFRIFTSYLFSSEWNIITPVHLFIYRLPLLVGDIVIYYVLSQILRTKEKLVTLLYWCSPILIYISYFHGQLDVLPIALLIIFIYLLYQNRFVSASVFLGLSMATKTHIVLVLPVYFIYLWKQRFKITQVFFNLIISGLTYVIILLPFLTSKGFVNLVFLAQEQFRIFNLFVFLSSGNTRLFIVPAIFLILFLAISTVNNMNKNLFLMVITLIYTLLVIFISPMPGWYYWSIPFVVFFIVKEGKLGHILTYGLLNLFYLMYFFFQKNSDVFHSFQVISPALAQLPTPFFIMQSLNLYPELVSDILITALTATLVIIVFWIYRTGIQNNLKYNLVNRPFVIGICGDSSSGKTTLSNLTSDLTGEINVTKIRGDDIHKWERGSKNWENYTHLDPKANKLYMNIFHGRRLIEGRKIKRKTYDHSTGFFTQPKRFFPKRFIIFEGLHQFIVPGMRDIYDLKIFLDIDDSLRKLWKFKRDKKERSYSIEKITKQLSARDKDSKSYINPQMKFADLVIKYEPITKIGDITKIDQKIDFSVTVKLKDYINIEELAVMLKEYDVEFEYKFEAVTFEIILKFNGNLSKKEIRKIAYKLLPTLHDILNNFNPIWSSDNNGLLQVIVLMAIDEKLKTKRENGS